MIIFSIKLNYVTTVGGCCISQKRTSSLNRKIKTNTVTLLHYILFAQQIQVKPYISKIVNQKEHTPLHSFIYLFICSFQSEVHECWETAPPQCRSQLSEGPVSWSRVDQSQDREGTRCCRHQTDGPNGPCSLWRQTGDEEGKQGSRVNYLPNFLI